MRYIRSVFIFIFCIFISLVTLSQSSGKPVFVLVHGAWGGGWSFKKTDSVLTEKGGIVYRPTLTGLGERVHLASPDIGLKTHINDVINLILYENLNNIILVGHSYGGMVITGVADSLPGRISRLIYLDALLPCSGESLVSIFGKGLSSMATDGFIYPVWVTAGKMPPKDVPHPLKTFTDTLHLKNPLRIKIPSTYILTVDKGKKATEDDFYSQSVRAKKMQWPLIQMEADHNPQWYKPAETAKILWELQDRKK